MPHQIIEYSDNLDVVVEVDELVRAMHEAASRLDFLPLGGLRTRAVPREHYLIADGHPDNSFIHVALRIAAGRTPEQKQQAGETLFATLTRFVDDVYREWPLALSLEVLDLDPEYRWKQNNIRDYMARRGN